MRTAMERLVNDEFDEPGQRGSQKVAKTFELLYALGTHGLSRREIGGLLGCDERTVYRYISDINRASLDGEKIIHFHDGRYRMARATEFLEIIGGSYDERAAAAIASSPFGGLLGEGHRIPERVLKRVSPFVDTSRGRQSDPLLRLLFEAMLHGSWISFDYIAEEESKPHCCVPVRLYLDPVQIYLVAWDEGYGHLICLATSKISGLKLIARPPMQASAFAELGDYCRGAWGKMVRHRERKTAAAKFLAMPAIAPYFERNKLRADQAEGRRPDGSLEISLKIHNPIEFTRFVLRFGEGVEILGDEEVLAEMSRFTRAMARRYGGAGRRR